MCNVDVSPRFVDSHFISLAATQRYRDRTLASDAARGHDRNSDIQRDTAIQTSKWLTLVSENEFETLSSTAAPLVQ